MLVPIIFTLHPPDQLQISKKIFMYQHLFKRLKITYMAICFTNKNKLI